MGYVHRVTDFFLAVVSSLRRPNKPFGSFGRAVPLSISAVETRFLETAVYCLLAAKKLGVYLFVANTGQGIVQVFVILYGNVRYYYFRRV